jgi:hypothetical protein
VAGTKKNTWPATRDQSQLATIHSAKLPVPATITGMPAPWALLLLSLTHNLKNRIDHPLWIVELDCVTRTDSDDLPAVF